jgi:hypothetical protein
MLDTVGLIANDFEDRFRSIQVPPDWATNGITMSRPVDPLDNLLEARIGPNAIWLHYGSRTDWTEIRQEIPKVIERVTAITGAKGYSRQGLRTMLAYPLPDADRAVQQLIRIAYNVEAVPWNQLGSPLVTVLQSRLQIGHLKAIVNIRPVKRVIASDSDELLDEGSVVVTQSEESEFPETALLLDTDIYDDRRTSSLVVKPLLNNAVDILQDKIAPFFLRIAREVAA